MSNTELAASTAASTAAMPVPDYLKKYESAKGEHRKDFGELSNADFGLSFVKLCQSTSKEHKRPGWGPAKNEAPMSVGTMFLSRDHRIITPGTSFIPLIRRTTYIRWIGKPGDGKIDFSTTDKNDPRIRACDGLAFKINERTGKTEAPLVSEYLNYYVWCQANKEEPVLLSFYRTGIKEGRQLMQDMWRGTKNGGLPLFTLLYKFGAPQQHVDGTQDWYKFGITPSGYAPPQVLAEAERMRDVAEGIANAMETMALERMEAGDADDQGAQEEDTGMLPTNSAPPGQAGGAGFVRTPGAAPIQQQQTLPPSNPVQRQITVPATQQTAPAAAGAQELW